MRSSKMHSPVPSHQDLEAQLMAHVHEAQAEVRHATDATRELALFVLLKALRDFSDLVFREVR
jgi:hypothetical protein